VEVPWAVDWGCGHIIHIGHAHTYTHTQMSMSLGLNKRSKIFGAGGRLRTKGVTKGVTASISSRFPESRRVWSYVPGHVHILTFLFLLHHDIINNSHASFHLLPTRLLKSISPIELDGRECSEPGQVPHVPCYCSLSAKTVKIDPMPKVPFSICTWRYGDETPRFGTQDI